MELPYRAEYAKSNRASCRGCKSSIGKDTLRLAVMVQSPVFDGRAAHWYHFQCFFTKQKPKSTDDIEHFESLRWDDQQKIKDKIQNSISASLVIPDKRGKKRNAANKSALADFTIEYAKSGRAVCRGCELKILKDEVRVAKKDYESEEAKRYGGLDRWYHLTCFVNLRAELGYFESADKIPGFKKLKKDDQQEAKKQLPAIKQEDVSDTKKVKTESEMNPLEKRMKEQNTILFKYRDKLKKYLNKNEMAQLLTYNDQEVPSGEEKILDRLSDIMTFGALEPCEVCKGGQYVFNKFGYICQGDLTEWTKCSNIEKKPKRRPFKVPTEFEKEYPFLKKYKYVKRERIFKDMNPISQLVKKEKDDPDGLEPKVKREKPALYNMEFVILGYTKDEKEELKEKIKKLGGKVVTKISRSVMAIIARESDVEKMGSRIEQAQIEDVHVVSKDFVYEAKDNVGNIPDLVIKKSICSWGCNPNQRLPPETSKSDTKSKSRSIFTSNVPSKQKLRLKDGNAVDPDSGIDDIAHVYKEGSDTYNVVLSKTDIQKQQNSFYKLQLLAGDHSNKFWVFRAWGRIGTTIGGTKLEDRESLHEALELFKRLYEEKTGNVWEERQYFKKVPGKFYPVEVDYGQDQVDMKISDKPSKLPKPVQDLIRLIFDVKSMEKLMLEFELDTEKMPLGKLSKSQIYKAYGVLSELQTIIKQGKEQQYLVDACNRFYTLIPHSFGVDQVPIIKDEETVKQKLEMLESLMEMEVAYSMMQSVGKSDVDHYYAQLRADIEVLEKTSEEYQIIEKYVRNTHAKTHSNYQLQIVDVHKVRRHGEELRYKPFKKLHNRKLLWHGSRITNFAGILSHGLRIAPKEAPVTGYMFGKGVYFADMVSKSANYCSTNLSSPTGLLLLCEVALGNMHECLHAEYIEKLPKGKHSTKGIGKTYPNPSESHVVDDGVEIPLGTPVEDSKIKSSLLYNEYIVYDVAQVHVKYLLKVDFKYKY